MAQQNEVARLTPRAIASLEEYLFRILETHKRYEQFRHKAESIDVAYYRYREEDDKKAGTIRCGVDLENIEVPVTISQADSFVGYLSDVFLSGYPLFPVVSSPKDMVEAEMLESIIDTHATLGSYARQLLMAFRDGIKYNVMGLEHDWGSIDQYAIVQSYLKPAEAARMEQTEPKITRIKRLNPYNLIWDHRIENPADNSFDGEFGGYIELWPRIPLKRFINKESQSGNLYRIGEALNSKWGGFSSHASGGFFTAPPTVNSLINQRVGNSEFDWMTYLGAGVSDKKGISYSSVYEKTTLYCRIIPSEHNMNDVPRKNSPQIWKFIVINGRHLLYACRVYTAYDLLPVSIGQPLEDGFHVQTPSIAESQIPMQAIASTLFNIRLASARRAVSDRAIYNSTLINESDVNSPVPAAKIPVRLSGLNDQNLDNAYKQIPFDDSGTQGVIGDVRNVLEFADMLSGMNKPFRGQFQKGNKSVQEWSDTMGNADNRMRLPALCIEGQILMPLKENIKLNIFQHQAIGTYQSAKSGTTYEIDAAKLEQMRKKVMSFRIADGYTPKSKMASTDFLASLLQTLSQNQILAQSWGTALPAMFAHLAQLGGVRDIAQYIPQQPQQGAAGGTGAAASTPA